MTTRGFTHLHMPAIKPYPKPVECSSCLICKGYFCDIWRYYGRWMQESLFGKSAMLVWNELPKFRRLSVFVIMDWLLSLEKSLLEIILFRCFRSVQSICQLRDNLRQILFTARGSREHNLQYEHTDLWRKYTTILLSVASEIYFIHPLITHCIQYVYTAEVAVEWLAHVSYSGGLAFKSQASNPPSQRSFFMIFLVT